MNFICCCCCCTWFFYFYYYIYFVSFFSFFLFLLHCSPLKRFAFLRSIVLWWTEHGMKISSNVRCMLNGKQFNFRRFISTSSSLSLPPSLSYLIYSLLFCLYFAINLVWCVCSLSIQNVSSHIIFLIKFLAFTKITDWLTDLRQFNILSGHFFFE